MDHYDQVEDVLTLLEIPFRITQPSEISCSGLSPSQTLVVNCPGCMNVKVVANIAKFVEEGGLLLTADWALKNIIERAFPGTIRYNNRATVDDVVRIKTKNPQHPLLEGLMHAGSDILWWIEGGSYPITIIDTKRVEVLFTSKELENKYGEAPAAVTFTCGKGRVFHMISHYYLKRSEDRTARHKSRWETYVKEIGAEPLLPGNTQDYANLTTGQIESAYTSSKLLHNLIMSKRLGK